MLRFRGHTVEVNGVTYRVAAAKEPGSFLVHREKGHSFVGAFSVETDHVVAVDPDDERLLRSVAKAATDAGVVLPSKRPNA